MIFMTSPFKWYQGVTLTFMFDLVQMPLVNFSEFEETAKDWFQNFNAEINKVNFNRQIDIINS